MTDPKMLESFFKKIRITDDCWLWEAAKQAQGYGSFTWGPKTYRAHKLSYELHKQPVSVGLVLDHLCGVRVCVNPAHLEPVSIKDNLFRSTKTLAFKNKIKTHCKSGHEFTEKNTYRHPKRPTTRGCRICIKMAAIKHSKKELT